MISKVFHARLTAELFDANGPRCESRSHICWYKGMIVTAKFISRILVLMLARVSSLQVMLCLSFLSSLQRVTAGVGRVGNCCGETTPVCTVLAKADAPNGFAECPGITIG